MSDEQAEQEVLPAPDAAAAEPVAPKPIPKAARPGGWELTERGVKVAGREFNLRSGATPEVLIRYADEAATATRVYAVLTSAEDEISGGRGEFDHLLDRTRATVRARDLASDEIQRLTNIFCRFFEPDGIELAVGPGKLSELALDVVEHFTRRRR